MDARKRRAVLGLGLLAAAILSGVIARRWRAAPEGLLAPDAPSSDERREERGLSSGIREAGQEWRPGKYREDDLLNLLRESGALSSGWAFIQTGLVTPHRRYSRQDLSTAPDSERYELEVRGIRRTKGSSLVVGIPVMKAECMIVVDGGIPSSIGIDQIDGRPFFENESTKRGPFLANDTPFQVTVRVRRNAITVLVDSRDVLHWQGEDERLSLFPRWKSERSPRQIFLGTWDSEFLILGVKLRSYEP